MKKTLNTPRVISSMMAVALLGLIVGSPAWGQDVTDDLLDIYRIARGNSTRHDGHGRPTNDVHEKAIYIVFKTPDWPTLAGLLFMERQGTYEDQPFICDAAVWSDLNKSYSCPRFVARGRTVVKETLTIGTINGPFCDSLRGTYNKDNRLPILRPQDCATGDKCSCYEITHEHLGPTSGDEAAILAPPGNGAGSGKNN